MIIRGLGAADGRFLDLAAMVVADVRENTEIGLSTGERYWVSTVDGGDGILLDNGLYANPISSVSDELDYGSVA